MALASLARAAPMRRACLTWWGTCGSGRQTAGRGTAAVVWFAAAPGTTLPRASGGSFAGGGEILRLARQASRVFGVGRLFEQMLDRAHAPRRAAPGVSRSPGWRRYRADRCRLVRDSSPCHCSATPWGRPAPPRSTSRGRGVRDDRPAGARQPSSRDGAPRHVGVRAVPRARPSGR